MLLTKNGKKEKMAGQARVNVVEDNTAAIKSKIARAIKDGLDRIGMKAEGYAKDLCPVGTPESTGIPGYIGGTLRNSITHITIGDSVMIGTNVEYAPYVEYGTSKQRAQPYLRPAAQNHGAEYREILKDALKNG